MEEFLNLVTVMPGGDADGHKGGCAAYHGKNVPETASHLAPSAEECNAVCLAPCDDSSLSINSTVRISEAAVKVILLIVSRRETELLQL